MSATAGTSRPKVNLRSTAVKRIMQEASELGDGDEDVFVAAPLESDIFEWHCTMRGVPDSEYDGGLYHLRILLPPSYPMSAPDIMLLTPNGRFELGKKICIDGLTSFHAGSWQPAWGVRTAILGLRSFWMQTGEALSAIGALDFSKEERRRLAKLSKDWTCTTCGVSNRQLLPDKRAIPSRANGAVADEERIDRSEKREVPPDLKPEPEEEAIPPISLSSEATIPDLAISEVLPSIISQRPPPPEPPNPTTSPAPASGLSQPPLPPFATTTAASPPSHTRTSTANTPRTTPVWLDALIFVTMSILVLLIARRLAKSPPLDHLE